MSKEVEKIMDSIPFAKIGRKGACLKIAKSELSGLPKQDRMFG